MAEHGCRRENRFEHLAEMCRDEQQRVLDNDKEHLATALVLLRRREKESATIGPRHHIWGQQVHGHGDGRSFFDCAYLARVSPGYRRVLALYTAPSRAVGGELGVSTHTLATHEV